MDSCILNVLHNKSVDRTPIWLMRQAGRYLPEYRQVRKQAGSFLSLCKNSELAAEVTLQPLKRFNFDAAIIFSDILVIPDAYKNLELDFIEKIGPCFNNPVRTEQDALSLPTLDIEKDLKYVLDAIKVTKENLPDNIPLIGFAGSPWTIATYMVEGQSSKSFNIIKKMLYKNPKILKTILQNLADNIVSYAIAKIDAGADIFMLFDTWGGVLAKKEFIEFSLSYIKQIVTKIKVVHPNVPIIVFSKNGGKHLDEIKATGCNAMGLDWTASISDAKSIVGDTVLQGNLDPSILYGSFNTITNKVKQILAEFGDNPKHIFNLGHGIHPDIEPEKVEHLVNVVREESKQYYTNNIKTTDINMVIK